MKITAFFAFGLMLLTSVAFADKPSRKLTELSPELAEMCELYVNTVGYGAAQAESDGVRQAVERAVKDVAGKEDVFGKANFYVVTKNEIVTKKRVEVSFYNCSQQVADANKLEAVPAQKLDDVLLLKAKKCQEKGGVWVNDLCAISID